MLRTWIYVTHVIKMMALFACGILGNEIMIDSSETMKSITQVIGANSKVKIIVSLIGTIHENVSETLMSAENMYDQLKDAEQIGWVITELVMQCWFAFAIAVTKIATSVTSLFDFGYLPHIRFYGKEILASYRLQSTIHVKEAYALIQSITSGNYMDMLARITLLCFSFMCNFVTAWILLNMLIYGCDKVIVLSMTTSKALYTTLMDEWSILLCPRSMESNSVLAYSASLKRALVRTIYGMFRLDDLNSGSISKSAKPDELNVESSNSHNGSSDHSSSNNTDDLYSPEKPIRSPSNPLSNVNTMHDGGTAGQISRSSSNRKWHEFTQDELQAERLVSPTVQHTTSGIVDVTADVLARRLSFRNFDVGDGMKEEELSTSRSKHLSMSTKDTLWRELALLKSEHELQLQSMRRELLLAEESSKLKAIEIDNLREELTSKGPTESVQVDTLKRHLHLTSAEVELKTNEIAVLRDELSTVELAAQEARNRVTSVTEELIEVQAAKRQLAEDHQVSIQQSQNEIFKVLIEADQLRERNKVYERTQAQDSLEIRTLQDKVTDCETALRNKEQEMLSGKMRTESNQQTLELQNSLSTKEIDRLHIDLGRTEMTIKSLKDDLGKANVISQDLSQNLKDEKFLRQEAEISLQGAIHDFEKIDALLTNKYKVEAAAHKETLDVLKDLRDEYVKTKEQMEATNERERVAHKKTREAFKRLQREYYGLHANTSVGQEYSMRSNNSLDDLTEADYEVLRQSMSEQEKKFQAVSQNSQREITRLQKACEADAVAKREFKDTITKLEVELKSFEHSVQVLQTDKSELESLFQSRKSEIEDLGERIRIQDEMLQEYDRAEEASKVRVGELERLNEELIERERELQDELASLHTQLASNVPNASPGKTSSDEEDYHDSLEELSVPAAPAGQTTPIHSRSLDMRPSPASLPTPPHVTPVKESDFQLFDIYSPINKNGVYDDETNLSFGDGYTRSHMHTAIDATPYEASESTNLPSGSRYDVVRELRGQLRRADRAISMANQRADAKVESMGAELASTKASLESLIKEHTELLERMSFTEALLEQSAESIHDSHVDEYADLPPSPRRVQNLAGKKSYNFEDTDEAAGHDADGARMKLTPILSLSPSKASMHRSSKMPSSSSSSSLSTQSRLPSMDSNPDVAARLTKLERELRVAKRALKKQVQLARDGKAIQDETIAALKAELAQYASSGSEGSPTGSKKSDVGPGSGSSDGDHHSDEEEISTEVNITLGSLHDEDLDESSESTASHESNDSEFLVPSSPAQKTTRVKGIHRVSRRLPQPTPEEIAALRESEDIEASAQHVDAHGDRDSDIAKPLQSQSQGDLADAAYTSYYNHDQDRDASSPHNQPPVNRQLFVDSVPPGVDASSGQLKHIGSMGGGSTAGGTEVGPRQNGGKHTGYAGMQPKRSLSPLYERDESVDMSKGSIDGGAQSPPSPPGTRATLPERVSYTSGLTSVESRDSGIGMSRASSTDSHSSWGSKDLQASEGTDSSVSGSLSVARDRNGGLEFSKPRSIDSLNSYPRDQVTSIESSGAHDSVSLLSNRERNQSNIQRQRDMFTSLSMNGSRMHDRKLRKDLVDLRRSSDDLLHDIVGSRLASRSLISMRHSDGSLDSRMGASSLSSSPSVKHQPTVLSKPKLSYYDLMGSQSTPTTPTQRDSSLHSPYSTGELEYRLGGSNMPRISPHKSPQYVATSNVSSTLSNSPSWRETYSPESTQSPYSKNNFSRRMRAQYGNEGMNNRYVSTAGYGMLGGDRVMTSSLSSSSPSSSNSLGGGLASQSLTRSSTSDNAARRTYSASQAYENVSPEFGIQGNPSMYNPMYVSSPDRSVTDYLSSADFDLADFEIEEN